MTIELYNTRTRRKEPFEPLDRSNVRMYVCGPTVYDRAHIGNARPVVVFDVLYRLLRHVYGAGHVTYVRNITDVDDKIIGRAQETLAPGETLEAATRRITDETIGWYHEDMAALGALPPTHEPRCTEYIPQMVEMTRALVEKGVAYEAEGHVLFEVAKWPRYGELSGRSTDDMIAGARVEVAPYKRSPMDFVLWKPSTPDQPGWPSPWGRGRPGWHIECSAMAEALLGAEFDIHGGGIDLAFPHHENELAQSCCVHDTARMAQFWMHNGFLQVEGEKMSKSLGNFFTVRDLLERNPGKYGHINIGPAIRFRLLHTHYRKPVDWTERGLEEAVVSLDKFRHALQGAAPSLDWEQHDINADGFVDALCDDLNVAQAYATMHETADRLKRAGLSVTEISRDQTLLWKYCDFLGFSGTILEDFDLNRIAQRVKAETAERNPELSAMIQRLLAERQEARKAKDFARADAIRSKLDAAGVVVMDRPNAPTEWELSPDFDPAKLEALR